jgi:hypothetical protein
MSMYSAMRSTTGPLASNQPAVSEASLAMEELSMYEGARINGHDHHGDDEYEDLHTPLGQNIEHACR